MSVLPSRDRKAERPRRGVRRAYPALCRRGRAAITAAPRAGASSGTGAGSGIPRAISRPPGTVNGRWRSAACVAPAYRPFSAGPGRCTSGKDAAGVGHFAACCPPPRRSRPPCAVHRRDGAGSGRRRATGVLPVRPRDRPAGRAGVSRGAVRVGGRRHGSHHATAALRRAIGGGGAPSAPAPARATARGDGPVLASGPGEPRPAWGCRPRVRTHPWEAARAIFPRRTRREEG